MKLPLKHLVLGLIVVAFSAAAWADDVSGWEFDWQLDREKPRHRPAITTYSKKADDHLAKGNFWRARYNYKKLYKTSRSLHNRGNAKLAIAVAHYGAGNYAQAIEELSETINHYANFIPFDKAVALEYTIASNHFEGQTDLLFSSLDEEAVKAYQHIQEAAPFSQYAERALFKAGILEIKSGNLNAGTVLMTKLINRYPKSEFRIKAHLELAHALLVMSQAAQGDPLLEKRARSELALLSSKKLSDEEKASLENLNKLADDIEVSTLLFQGAFYQRAVHWNPDASRRYLTEVIKKFSAHPNAEKAKQLLAKLPVESVKQ